MWWKFRKNSDSSLANAKDKLSSFTANNTELRESGKAPLTDITRKVKQIEISTKKRTSTLLSGQYRSRFKGQGMQFADFRVYQFGDDIRHIDWRSSARSQQTYIRTYEEERELNILCVVDVSASNLFGTQDSNKKEILCLAIASIAFSAIENNDRVGLILFSDGVERYVPPKKGRKHVLRIIDELLSFKPQKKHSDLNKTLDFLSGVAKHNSIILLASDFFVALEKRALNILAKKHDLIALHAQDPRDFEIPSIGILQLEDPETGETMLINSSSSWLRRKLTESQKKQLQNTLHLIKRSGASLVPLKTEEDPAQELLRFFHARKRGKK